MEKFPFLIAVQRIVGGVDIMDNLFRRFGMRFEEDIDKKMLYRFRGHNYFLVGVLGSGIHRRQFQPIQRAFARQRFSLVLLGFPVHTCRIGFSHGYRQHLIFGQMIMVVEIFVPQGKTDNSLGYQRQHTMLYTLFISMICEACGETLKNGRALLNLPQQQATVIGSNGPSTEISDYFSFPQS